MKKIFILINLLLSFIPSECFSQSCNNLDLKYKHYRERLVSDFLLGVGPDQGFSIPAENRDEKIDNKLRWGDAGTYLGHYIAVLASEYRIYTLKGESTQQTIKELFYALYAVNRLDKYAETHFSGLGSNAPSLNGFFIRDDVDYFSSLPTAVQDHLNHGSTNHNEISNTVSDLISSGTYDKEESIDQIIQLLIGLGFVKLFIPPGLTYVSSSGTEQFQDNEASIQLEAINIIDRMISYTHDFYGVSSGCWSPPCWDIHNPVTGFYVQRGSHFGDLSYAVDKGCDFLTGGHISPGNLLDFIDKTAAKTTFEAFHISLINNNLHNAESDKICTLAAISDAWDFNTDDNSTYINQIEVNNYIHVPLIHSIFHPGTRINAWSKQDYLNLLNLMPDAIPPFTSPANCGNFMYSSTEHCEWEWTSSTRLLHYERRGDWGGSQKGEFNGLDFMLLYNLYYLNICCPDVLHFENKSYNSGTITFKAYNTIYSGYDNGGPDANGDVIIHQGANVQYQAGTDIFLTPGFYAEPGSEFYAYIESCCPEQFSSGIYIHTFPNSFSPNNNGSDKELCISVTGATSYNIKVYMDEPGGFFKVHEHSANIYTDPVCVWDGTGTQNWNLSEDYKVKVTFYGCDGTSETEQVVKAHGTRHLKTDSTYQAQTTDSIQSLSQNENSEVNRLSYLNSILMYPNPGNGQFAIESNSILSYKIEVYDAMGRIVFSSKIKNQVSYFNLHRVSQGVYFVKVYYSDGKIFTKKLVVQDS